MPELPAIPALTPYKMDVQQGNVVTQEMVEKLRPGMTPSQVRFILGTPLVVDAFHKDRWDYVYRFSKRGTLQESRRIVIVFQDDKLARIEGDVVPAKPGSTDAGVTIAPGAGKPGAAKPAAEKARPEPAAPNRRRPKRARMPPPGGGVERSRRCAGQRRGERAGGQAERGETQGRESPRRSAAFSAGCSTSSGSDALDFVDR